MKRDCAALLFAFLVSGLSSLPASAELRSWTCRFPTSANVLLPEEIDVRYDAASWNTVVTDSVTREYIGSPVKADVTELRTGTVIYDWLVHGLPRTLVYSSVFAYRLKIDPTGKSFLEMGGANLSGQRAGVRGRCD